MRNGRTGDMEMCVDLTRKDRWSSFLWRRSAGVLVAWSLLTALFSPAHAEIGQVPSIREQAQNTRLNRACETCTMQLLSISSLPSSRIPLPDDRREDQLQPMGLHPAAYAASSENSPAPSLQDIPSCIEKTSRITAAGDTLPATSPGPSEDQPCEKSDIPPAGDQVAGVVPGKDWPGIGRDTAYFLGYQVVIIGTLYVLPERITNWSEEDKEEYDLARWGDNVRNPAWDSDIWYVNYVLHPYWGAAYYVRARERGFNKPESFVYSAFLSALYEFGAEALFERPSYQDLIVTPIGGALLGMYVFEPIRERIKAKGPEQQWHDKLVLVLTDPLGTVSDFTDRVLGIKSSARIIHPASDKQRCRPVDGNAHGLDRAANSASCRTSYTGLELTFRW